MVACTILTSACGSEVAAEKPGPRLGAEIVQLRRDEVLQRVEVAITNRSSELVTVESINLRVPGYSGGGEQDKNEPLPVGQQVNLPTPYGTVDCSPDGPAHLGRPRVAVRVHTTGDPRSRRLVLQPRDPAGLLKRIAQAECQTRRLTSEVTLSFGPRWRRTGRGERTVLHGTLEAQLKVGTPRDLTQVGGTVIYNLAPSEPGRRSSQPLAHLTPADPHAAVPILVTRSRCDGHARAETKKPYAFLVWLGPPGGAQQAISPTLTDVDRAALAQVCPL